MRRFLPALLLALALLPACKRGRVPPTSGNQNGAAAGQAAPGANDNPQTPGGPAGPGRVAPPPVSSWEGGDVPLTNARGTATIGVDGTALNDFILYGLTLDNGAFRLDGQGLALVGKMSRAWEGTLGKAVAILPQVDGIGASELNLPQVGIMKVTGGQIVLDESVKKGNSPRARGRLLIEVEGPAGKVNFTGKFEVGIVLK